MKESIKYIFRRLGFATKVNTFIIGAQKCGTTSLHEALCSHSRCIEAPFKKELHFWSNGPGPNLLAEYESQFPFLSAKFRLLDSTPNYLFETSVISRIHRYNPNAKFIVLLRNPIKRAFSAWSMYHHAFQKRELFGEALQSTTLEILKLQSMRRWLPRLTLRSKRIIWLEGTIPINCVPS